MLGLAKRLRCRILQASTSEVYGDPHVHPQQEEYWGNVNPIGPRSCYDEGKRCAETLVLRLPPAAPARNQGCAYLQHLRSAHAPQRRARGVELHCPVAEGRAHHDLRRRQPDTVVLLRRRADRSGASPHGYAGADHRPDQYRQSSRVHDPRVGRARHRRSPARARRSCSVPFPTTIPANASPTSRRQERCSNGSPKFRCGKVSRARSPISTSCFWKPALRG